VTPGAGEIGAGTEVAGYRLERLLARGGTSVVYVAEHVALGRRVALKLLAPELAEDPRFRERFLRESRAAGGLDHPNIIPVYDAGETEGRLYIAMRLVEGGDLHALIRSGGPLEPTRALRIVDQVASALDAAHDAGLVHRDVKPSNVLVLQSRASGDEDHAYLADFGLAAHAAVPSKLTRSGGLLGTVDYVAPEQIMGIDADRRADVYGLGCVLYECLTGEVPYPRASQLAALWAHVNDPPPSLAGRLPGLSPAADGVIARALAKAADERFPTCGELAAAAGEALAGEAPARRRRRPGRRVAALAGAAAVAVAGLAVALVLTLGGSSPSAPTRLGADSVGRLDAASGRIEKAIRVGRTPTQVALGPDALWVADEGDRDLWELDPASVTMRRVVPLGQPPTDLAVARDGTVFVAEGFAGQQVVRIDPSGRVRARRHIDGSPRALALAANTLWVVDETGGRLLRLDPSTLTITRTVKLGTDSDPVDVTADAADVWVADAQAPKLIRVDPRTLRKLPSVSLRSPPGRLVTDRGVVWVTLPEQDEVYRADPARQEQRTIPVPDDPVNLAADPAGGAVWVASGTAGVVSRIDPATQRAAPPVSVGRSPDGLAVGDGALWVTVYRQ
jgi:streptogramin lyase/tRNA A-37 threonylcarbamoyl transferase component Bud32